MSVRAKREENFWILHGEFFWILQTKKTVKRKRNGKGNFEILLHAKRGNNFRCHFARSAKKILGFYK